MLKGFRDGFSIGLEGPRTPRFSRNLKSANEHPDLVTKNLLSEVKLGRTAGPSLSPPFPNFQIYPIGVVPKKYSSDWRTIFHLSHPKASGNSVNDYISKENYSLQYVKHDDAINLIIQLGRGSYMAKTDIRSAFRNIPVHPSDWEILGMHWQGLYFFDKVLPFGLRCAPYIFNQLSDALEWIAKTNYDIKHILHILDDFFLIEPPPRASCMTSLCKLLTLMTNVNVPIAHKKTHPASTELEFLGVLLNSEKMIACLPADKLTRTKQTLFEWLSKKSCTLHELQSLIGMLQFACRVVVPVRAFLQRMINLTRGVTKPHHHIKLNSSFRKDVAMWLVFLEQSKISKSNKNPIEENKNAQKEENKDENLLIMSNVVVFRQDCSRINSRFLKDKFKYHCFVKARLQFIISKNEQILHVKEYNHSYFNENVCMFLLF